jgi:hypothetical protein
LRRNRFLGGWQVNTIVSLQSGVPFSPVSSSSAYDVNKNGTNNDRLVYTESGSPMSSATGRSPADGYFDTGSWARYVCPASVNSGLWCDSLQGRNTMVGPGYKNVDFNLTKRFRLKEGVNLSFQGNFFNLFNHTNFGLPAANQQSSSFGKSTSSFDPRITQLALRLDF